MAQNSSTSQSKNTFRVIQMYPEAILPHRAHDKDAGLDVFACFSEEQRRAIIAPGQSSLVPTGLKVEIPDDVVALLVPNSGRSVKRPFMQPNAPGTLDPGYQGELMVPQRNLGSGQLEVTHGEKIGQLLFMPLYYYEPQVVQKFTASSQRGEKGFGSTDK